GKQDLWRPPAQLEDASVCEPCRRAVADRRREHRSHADRPRRVLSTPRRPHRQSQGRARDRSEARDPVLPSPPIRHDLRRPWRVLLRRAAPRAGDPQSASAGAGAGLQPGDKRRGGLGSFLGKLPRSEPRFVDLAPAQVYAHLLDEGRYLCSLRTMYRLLAACQEVRERRDQLRHPRYVAPQLLATRPNEVWSWDITKLLGPVKWTYFYLYVILDVFSRYVVGWMVAHRESARLAQKLIAETCARHGITPGGL